MDKEEAFVIVNDGYEEEVTDEETEVSYEDICQAVVDQKRISYIRKLLEEYEVTKYENMDYLDMVTDDLWYNVMVPYLETFGKIDKHDFKFRCEFSKWLYENSNIGRQLSYIMTLEKTLITETNQKRGNQWNQGIGSEDKA